MAQDSMYFEWGMRGKLEEQIKSAAKDGEHLREVIQKLQIDISKLSAEQIQKNFSKNIDEAEKALYRLLTAKENIDKALSRNASMRSDGFLGMDESKILQVSARLDDIINKLMNIGAEAQLSKTAVKDMLSSLSADIALKEAKSSTSAMDKGLDKQIRERAKAQKEAIKEIEGAFNDADKAAAINAKNQERVKDALSKIATARANLSAASEKGSQQEITHARLLMSMLDGISGKLNALKGQFLGEKGALDGVLGSGYKGLMRNVSVAIRDLISGMLNAGGMSDSQWNTEKALAAQLERRKDITAAVNEEAAAESRINELIAMRQHRLEMEAQKIRENNEAMQRRAEIEGNSAAWHTRNAELAAQAEREKELLRLREVIIKRYNDEAAAQERLAAQQERSAQRQRAQNHARQEATQATRKQAEELVRLRMELLRTQAAELQSLMKNGRGTFGTQQYQQIQDALRSVRKEMAELEGVMQRMSTYSIRDLFNFGRGTQNWSPLIQNSQAVLTAQQSIRQLSSEEEKLMQSFERANSSMNNQSVLLGDLQTMVANYLSLWGMKGFLNNIIEIGGQLEMQRLSIAAILGDAAQANDLFEKIKSLAVQSPFGVVELDQYTKQLSAYGFKYNELYDMTKRLADISAGAGTEVGRLALALGHVRSEGALTGYTLRQFAMNNIPMLGELSKQLTEVEGKLVTTAEIRKRIHNKQIGYEEVEAVIKKLTDEGGMFYNMQEVVSQSVKARFKNLKDSLDIMYGEMAESDLGGELKAVAATLTGLTRHWKELFSVLRAGAIILGSIKLLSIQNRVLLGAEAAAVQKGVTAKVRAHAANIKLASSYRSLTAAEQAFTGARGKALVVANALALSEKKLTAEGVARQVALGRLTKAEAHQAIALADLTAAEKIHANAIVSNVYTYGRFTGVVNAAAMSFRKLGAALKGLVWNPLTAIFAVVGIGTELWQRNNEEVERASELNDDLFHRAQEGIRNIKDMMGETGMTFTINGKAADFGGIEDLKKGGKFEFRPVDTLTTAEMVSAIESWTEFIKDYASNKNSILNDAFLDDAGNIRSTTEQYERLGKAVSDTAEAYAWLKQASDAAEYGMSSTNTGLFGGVFNDDLIENINDYSAAQKDYNDAVSNSVRQHRQFYSAILKAARGNTAFSGTLKREKIDAENLSEQIKILLGDQERYAGAIEAARKAAAQGGYVFNESYMTEDYVNLGYRGTLADYQAELTKSRETMEADIDLFVDGMKQRLQDLGWNLSDLTKGQEYAIGLSIAEIVGKASKGTDDVRNEVVKLTREKFGIQLDADTAEAVAKVSQLQQSLEQLVGHDWHIDIKTATNFADVISNVRKSYKSAKEYFENVEPLMVKMGIDITGGMKELGLTKRTAILNQWKKDNPGKNATMFEQMLQDWDAMAQQMNDALDFSSKTGIGLEDPNKNKHRNGGNKTDEQLKKVKERFEEIKTFYSEYKKYAKTYGKEGALVKLEALFPDLKGKDGQHLGRRIVDDYQNVLKEVRDSINGNTTERKKYKQSVSKLLADIDLDTVKEQLDKNLKAVEKEIQERTSQWNLYKSLLDKTGNKEFAMNAFSGGVLWDDATRGMRQRLEEMVGKPVTDWDASDESAKKAFGEGSAALKLYQEIVKSIRKNWTDGLNDIAEATSKLMTTEDKIVKAERELAELRGKYGKNDPRVVAKERELGKLQIEALEQSEPYLKFYSAIFAMAADEAEAVGMSIKKNLVKQLAEGKINADKYLKSIKNIDQQLQKMRGVRSDALTLMTGGVRGLLEKRSNVYDSKAATAAIRIQKEQEKIDKERRAIQNAATKEEKMAAQLRLISAQANKKFAETELLDAQKKLGWTQKSLQQANKVLEVMELVTGVLDGMKQSAQQLSDMFDALGHEHTANTWSDISDTIGALSAPVSESVNALKSAMSGDVGGAISHTVGIFTSPVTAFAKLHDKKLQRRIEESERNVRSLTTAYQNLQSAIESALGGIYATGGYNEMYENLQKQREEIQRQYDDEAAKKKSDKDKLVDYEQQLKEMDESIKNFGLDMAKSLYDIDLHSWASQLTEAIVGAWEKGEDAAEAYKDKVKELMKDLTSNILTKKVMERAFDTLGIDKMISEEMFNTEGKLSEDFIPRLTEALLKVGDVTTDVITGVLNELEGKGAIEKGSESKTSSKVIQGGFTEQETGLLLSYVNAIRGDVSENRMTLVGILNAVQTQTEMPVIARAQLQQLQQVAENTRRNADAADRIYEVLHSNILGANSFQIK